MKTILISIQPQYLVDILNKKKTLELRTVVPQVELPCKYIIYCSKEKHINGKLIRYISPIDNKYNFTIGYYGEKLNGKVVAEFICNEINEFCFNGKGFYDIQGKNLDYEKTCLSLGDILHYATRKNSFETKNVFTIKIDNLKIYDTPRRLSDLKKQNKCYYANCDNGCCWENCVIYNLGDCDGRCSRLERAPQSYQFIEEI